MSANEIVSVDLNIDRSHLSVIKKRFLTLNQERFKRTSTSLEIHQQVFLDLIAMLFHTNHPVLPGYVDKETPAGIQQYTPSKDTLKKIKSISKGFRYQSTQKKCENIEAIFVMGSIGTIGQSRSSDLDFWICHDPDLTHIQLTSLKKKCDNISQWSQSLGLDVVFFPMNAVEFKDGKTSALSEESSGSTQHKLLLDEFYRTAIHIAGRMPLWWFVDPNHENFYTEYASQLIDKRFIAEKSVIDFGGLDNINSKEFITSSVWQLYKAIQSPYKSLLKLMLIEVYATRKSNLEILSLTLKSEVFNNKISIDEIDPYFLMYKAIERHLKSNKQDSRIDLLRRCFYIKIDKPLSKKPHTSPPSWQRKVLKNIVSNWQWSEFDIALLDNKPTWSAIQVIDERHIIINELLTGYRFLNAYLSEHKNVIDNKQNQEISLLGRKLFAAFEKRSGKIENINPGISKDISENYLTFHKKDNFNGTSQWFVYTQKKTDAKDTTKQLSSSNSLIELITWCFCNKIFTDQTQSSIIVNNQSIRTDQFFSSLKKWHKSIELSTKDICFYKKPIPLNVLIFANILPSKELSNKVHADNFDIFSYGQNKINLITDLHMVVQNSWDEKTVYSHENNSVDNIITDFLNLKNSGSDESLSIEKNIVVHCEDQNHSAVIKNRIRSLLIQLENLFIIKNNSNNIFVITVENYFLCFERNIKKITSYLFKDRDQLIIHLSKSREQLFQITFDEKTLINDPLNIIYKTIGANKKTSAIQLFYKINNKKADIYIIDELNSLTFYQLPFHDEQSLLRPLHRFIRSIIGRQELVSDDIDNFGVYPVSFYQLLKRSDGQYKISAQHVTNDLANLHFFNIQAIANHDNDGNIEFSIYCADKPFHPSEHGESLYQKVAQYIFSRRASAETYPCYLTDLDLGNSPQKLIGNTSLQTCHFLQYKKQLEQKINQALYKL